MTVARTDKKFFIFACLTLAFGTLALYWPVTRFPFINFDDPEYISENPVTQAGLTWQGLVWAFNGIHVGNWHPVSWLSHMIDCQIFGVNAGGHHLMNVLFHIANTLLLFAFLRSATGFEWRSAFVGCILATSLQISYWRNSESLFLHALEVTRNNYVAENALGKYFEKNGDHARALVLYQDAVRIEPRFASSQYNLGLALIGFGHKDEALEHLAAAAQFDPGNPDAQYNLGIFFLQNKRWADAAHCFEATLKLRPEFAPARVHLAEALAAHP